MRTIYVWGDYEQHAVEQIPMRPGETVIEILPYPPDHLSNEEWAKILREAIGRGRILYEVKVGKKEVGKALLDFPGP